MLGLTGLDLLVLTGYLSITVVIGFCAHRLIHNREDFLMGSRRFGKVMTVLFAFGAGTHAESAVGVAAQSYKVGLAGIWYQWIMIFTLPLYWLLAPVFRRARVLTTADFFERRYGTAFMLLYAVFALFILSSMTGIVLYGSARLVEALTGQAISWEVVVLLIAGISFIYGITGGLIAVVWNDCLQGVLTIVMSVLIIPFFWTEIGGLSGFQQALPDPKQAFRLVLDEDLTLYWIIAVAINSLFSVVATPYIMANIGAAKTEMDAQVGFVGGMILKRLMTIPWALTGVMAVAYFGSDTLAIDHAYGAMAKTFLPSGFAGLMLACVIASVMDNYALAMLSFAGLYVNNIYRHLTVQEKTEAKLVGISRIAATFFCVLSLGSSYAFTDVPAAMRFLWNTIPLMGIPFLLGICWRRANRYGAFAAFAAALVAMLIGQYVFEWTGDRGLPKVITLFISSGLLAGIVISLLTRPEPSESVESFFLLLRTPVGEERILRDAGFREIPGTGTFEMPRTTGKEPAILAQARVEAQSWKIGKASKQSVYGFLCVTIIMLAMLGGVKLLAGWLAGNGG